jgi:anti-sigma regulatory factor (Ser/Thr protein kinase)
VASSHDAFRLTAQGAAVAEARRRVQSRLCEWGVDGELCDDAGLIVSELFTNALRYGDSEKIACAVRFCEGLVRIEVGDQGHGPTVPLPRVAEEDEECGRGLLLVSVLSKAWGVLAAEGGAGRVVWAELGPADRSEEDDWPE